jgi:hypothetical protein
MENQDKPLEQIKDELITALYEKIEIQDQIIANQKTIIDNNEKIISCYEGMSKAQQDINDILEAKEKLSLFQRKLW